MNRSRWLLLTTQVGLVAAANYLAVQTNLNWPCLLGLGIFSVAAIAAEIAPSKSTWLWIVALLGTTLAWAAAWAINDRLVLDVYYAVIAGQAAVGIFIIGNQSAAERAKSKWNFLGMAWGFLGTSILLAGGYLDNLPSQFCLGLVCGLLLLILCRACFQLRAVGIQIVNTLILMLVMLPVADTVVRFKSRHDMGLDPGKYYSFEAAQKNPGAYALWTRYYGEQWEKMARQVMMYDPSGAQTFKLKPDSHGTLFHSSISVDHKGFRGPEIPDEKGNVFRIVALGESTTFGCTLNREDRPWPELLEQMIRERIHPARPVEVINAGIPAATLPGNLHRLTNEILSLKPDMIISYHGFNGFYMLQKGMPPIISKPPPGYKPRPSILLGDFEYALKLKRFKRTVMPGPIPDQPLAVRPMESDYAKAYQQLIEITQANGIRLVLANYSMAVNTNSDRALFEFYRQTSPALQNSIKANLAHSEIVQELAREHPEICFVDTHPALDGKHENFIDLVHFTQNGRQLMAETFFAGIRKTLEADLAKKGGVVAKGTTSHEVSSSAATSRRKAL